MGRADFEAFLKDYLGWAAPLERARNQAWWDAALGDHQASTRLTDLEREWTERHADAATFGRLRDWRANAADWPELLHRQLEACYLTYFAEQRDPASLSRELELEQQLRDSFNSFRATINGRTVDDNELDELLQNETDATALRAAWEASKQIGAKVAPPLRELAKLRNASARRDGFSGYWERALAIRQIEPARLDALLEAIDSQTDTAFRAAKAGLDAKLALRYGISVAGLRPWHYQDRFFQRAPSSGEDPLEPIAQRLDLIPAAVRSYDGLGIDLRAVVERSDFFPRPGKSQHAFCTHIDRQGDVRVLLNVVPSARWLRTLLHELGHAAYEDELSPELPFLLRDGAHPLIHEGLAMLLEELADEPDWLTAVGGVPAGEAADLATRLVERKRVDRLVFIRWCLCIVRFERALYADPDQDLDSLWWQEVQRSQHLTPPEDRHAPDWAAKIHLAEAPVYYQSYFLGQLFAAQLGGAIRARTGGKLAESEESGRYLLDQLFRHGMRWGWERTVERATGTPLGVEAFARAVG